MKKITAVLLTLILAFSLAQAAFASVDNGTLSISATDSSGAQVNVPKANAGERVTVRIPLLCSGNTVSDISITPVISTSVEEFPFEVEKLNYTQTLNKTLSVGEITEFAFDFKLREEVTSGVKSVKFSVSYKDALSQKRGDELTLYVNVEKGFSLPEPTSIAQTTPVLMLEGYSTDVEKIYAGSKFTLTLTVKNTSSEESVKNIQVKLQDGTGTVMPSNGKSSSAYIESLARGASKRVSFTLETPPDADEAKYALVLSMNYQAGKSLLSCSTSENITLSILQEQRIKIEEPTVYDEARVGTVAGVSLAIYNMGKSPVYNCMVTLDGEGLSLVENYFGGTLVSGGTLRPDLEVLTSKAGLINGTITVTYEDAYGVQSVQSIPLEIRVEEEKEVVITPIPDNDEGNDTSFPWVGFTVIAIIVTVIIIALVIRKKQKRNKEEF